MGTWDNIFNQPSKKYLSKEEWIARRDSIRAKSKTQADPFSPESVVDRIDTILGGNSGIQAPKFNTNQPDATYVNPNKTDMSSPIINDIGNTIKAPFDEAANAGRELGKGLYEIAKNPEMFNENFTKGTLDLAKSVLHGVMLPATVPITAATSTLREGLNFDVVDPLSGKTVNLGKEAEGGVSRAFNIPFDALKMGSKYTGEALKAIGVDLPKDTPVSAKVNDLLIELGGLWLFKKAHEGGNKLVKEVPPLKVVNEAINNVKNDLKQTIEIPKESKTVVEDVKKQEAPVETPKLPSTETAEPQSPVKGTEVKPEVKEPVKGAINPVLESKKRKEESRLETEKLNKEFEQQAIKDELAMNIADRVESKIKRGAELTKEETNYFAENQYAPKGYKYDAQGNLVKNKPESKTKADVKPNETSLPVGKEPAKGIEPTGDKGTETPVTKVSDFVPEFGEEKLSGVAKSSEAVGVANDVIEKVKELPTYNEKKDAPQINFISDKVVNDLPRVEKWLSGDEPIPDNLNSGFIRRVVEDYAIKNKNFELFNKLVDSKPLAEAGTEAGREVRSFQHDKKYSGVRTPTEAVSEISKARTESVSKTSDLSKRYEEKIRDLEAKLNLKETELSKRDVDQVIRDISYEARRAKRQTSIEEIRAHRTKLAQELYKETSGLNLGVPLSGKAIKLVGEMAKDYVSEGIIKAEAIVDGIYTAMEGKIDKKAIRDAISGYGKTIKRVTRSELQKNITELKKQLALISKIEDVEQGQLPKVRDIAKGEPNKTTVELRKDLSSKLKESGLADEKNLKRARKIVNTKIAEYIDKIKQGDYVKEERKVIVDPVKESLQKQLTDVRKRWSDIQKNVGEKLTPKESKDIFDLFLKENDLRQKMEASKERGGKGKRTPEEIAYGKARVEYDLYIDRLKEAVNAITFKHLKEDPYGITKKFAKEIPGMTKSIAATLDNSAIFNPGIRVLWNKPNIWARNSLQTFRDMYRTWKGENVFAEIGAYIASSRKFEDAMKDKLAVNIIEEAFPASKLLEKVPIIGSKLHKSADAAYTGWMYRNRMDLYEHFTDVASKNGFEKTTGLGISNFVNSMTGRGNLGRLEGAADVVNVWFFSPRRVKSHFDVLTAHLFDKNASKFVKKEAAISLLKIAAGTTSVLAMAKAMGADVELDPRSSDFGKVKRGNTRFDVTGGLSSMIVLASRLGAYGIDQTGISDLPSLKKGDGKLVKLGEGGWGSETAWDKVLTFGTNKLSPPAGLGRDFLIGETPDREKFSLGKGLLKLVTPLPIQNTEELLSDPESAPVVAGIIADGLGIFTSTYPDYNDPKQKRIRQLKDLIKKYPQNTKDYEKELEGLK